MRVFTTVGQRVFADFLMPDRLDTYRGLLETAIAHGYQVQSVASFWTKLRHGLESGQRHLILRHDIDTDSETARQMWHITKDLGATASYYFRLSTVDCRLMEEIASGGGEASYHYEELATVAKVMGLKSRGEVLREMPRIKDLFLSNLDRLRSTTGLPMTIVASHGDFINRKLGICNWEMLTDPAFRQSARIELEVYDDEVMAAIDKRHSDCPFPRFWKPEDPRDSIHANARIIYLLVHPRHWRVSRLENAKDNIIRMWEGARHSLA